MDCEFGSCVAFAARGCGSCACFGATGSKFFCHCSPATLYLRVVMGWQARWTPGTFPGPLRDFRCNDFYSSEIGGVCGVRVSFADLGGTAVSCSEAEFPRERARLETRARRRTPGYRIARMHPS
jgi:hypothetical protein